MTPAMMSVLLFIIGAAIPLIVNRPMRLFVKWLRNESGVSEPSRPRVPPHILGTFERYLAFILVAFRVPDTPTILVAWMLAKLAANWQRQVMSEGRERYNRAMVTYTLIALMAGTLSLLFGVLGV